MVAHGQMEEIAAAAEELREARLATEASLRAAMAADASVRIASIPLDEKVLVAGKELWDHSVIRTERLTAAADEMATLPPQVYAGEEAAVDTLLAQAHSRPEAPTRRPTRP